MAGKAKRERERAIRKEWKVKSKAANKVKYSTSPSKSSTGGSQNPNHWGQKKVPSIKKLYRGGPDPISKEEHKELLRREAAERQRIYDALTPQQKLDKLDMMFGKDKGAKRERAKLQDIISGKIPVKNKKAKVASPAASKGDKGRVEGKKTLQERIEEHDRRMDAAKANEVKMDYKAYRNKRKKELAKLDEDKKKASEKVNNKTPKKPKK